MAITETKYYTAEEGRPSYYVILYNGRYVSYDRPNRPFQIFKADSWTEATSFASAFVYMTQLQWMSVSALSPRGAYHGSNIETAHRDYWNENGQVYYKQVLLPSGILKSLSEGAEPIAQEMDDNTRKRVSEIKKLLESARPGETLADVIARKYQMQRNALTKERAEHLKKFGDYSPEQARLVEMAPEEAAKLDRKKQTGLDAFEKEVPMYVCSCGARLKDEIAYLTHTEQYPGHRPVKAYESDPPSKDTLGGSEITWRAFVSYLREHTGENFIKLDLKTIRENYADYTIDGAKDKADQDPVIAPYYTAESQIEELEEDPANARLKEDIEMLKSAGYTDRRIADILTKKAGLDLQRPTSEGLAKAKRELEDERKRVEELERQLAQRPATTASTPAKPSRPKVLLNFTEEQANLLIDYFTTVIRRVQRKDPTPAELDKVGAFIDRLQVVKPSIRFERARKQVEDYAKGLNALARGAKLPAKTEKARISDILNKMLEGPLTPEEEDELSKLEGKLESETDINLPLGVAEPQYPRPEVRLIADDGPQDLPLGTPIRPPQKYPRLIGMYWEEAMARVNAEIYAKRGYSTRVERI